jgi:hypothetical protein
MVLTKIVYEFLTIEGADLLYPAVIVWHSVRVLTNISKIFELPKIKKSRYQNGNDF